MDYTSKIDDFLEFQYVLKNSAHTNPKMNLNGKFQWNVILGLHVILIGL
jgi:hypothetical protein